MHRSEHRLAEAHDPLVLGDADAAALLRGAPWRRFAVMGDSLSAGVGDPRPGYRHLPWGDRVTRVLRRVVPGLEYLNTGEIRATTTDTMARQADRVLRFEPDLLHLPCGANDIVTREPDFDAIERTLRGMYDVAAATGAQLATFTLGRAYHVAVFADWRQRVETLNEITRGLAREFDAALIDMWDHPVNDRSDLLSDDGIHFAAAGQAVMATEVVKALAARLVVAPP